ncbi:MAG: ABC transporter permease subunit [Nitriliruptoraceae bacterium]
MTELLAEIVQWFAEPDRWSVGHPRGVPYRTLEHLQISTVATLIAVAIATPPALWLAHRRRAEAAASAIVNIGRAIPSFGLIVLFWLLATRIPWLGTQFWPLVAALVALALPPIFTNTYTAIREVDRFTIEAGRGMGLTERQILSRVEVPLAAPVIAAGVRLAYVQVIATTAIGAIVTNGGGLGRYIVDGFATGRAGRPAVLAGALLLATLTLLVEGMLWLLERRVIPPGVRGRPATGAAAAHTGAAG